jgi:hypothetical protein
MNLLGLERRTAVQRMRTVAFVAFAADDGERARRPLVQSGAVDIGTVDVLTRLRLRAVRAGLEMTLHGVCPELEALLQFSGLAAIFGLSPGG